MVLPQRRRRIIEKENIPEPREAISISRYSTAATYNPQLKEILKSNPRNLMYLRGHQSRQKEEQKGPDEQPPSSHREPRVYERIGTISERDETESVIPS